MKPASRFGLALLACGTVLAATSPPAAQADWRNAPVIPKLTRGEAKLIAGTLRRGRRLGNRADVFAKVGDSLSGSAAFAQGLGCHRWAPGRFQGLRATVRFFSARALPGTSTYCRAVNSFSRNSAATKAGQTSAWPLQSGSSDDPACAASESPLACEIRLTRPAYAVVLFGTNDVALALGLGFDPVGYFTANMARIISTAEARGVVPILSTIPPRSNNPAAGPLIDELNSALYQLAATRRVPVVNLWRAVVGLPNQGLSSDELHLSVYLGPQCIRVCNPRTCAPTCQPANFTAAGLRFGYDVRNLITLLTLRRVSHAGHRPHAKRKR